MRFHQRDVAGIDRAVRIHIFAEVRRRDPLPRLTLGLSCVTGVDRSVPGGVTDQNAIGIATLLMFVPSLTPKRVTTILCALVTPLRFTVTWAPLTLALVTLPTPVVTLALVTVTEVGKFRTN